MYPGYILRVIRFGGLEMRQSLDGFSVGERVRYNGSNGSFECKITHMERIVRRGGYSNTEISYLYTLTLDDGVTSAKVGKNHISKI